MTLFQLVVQALIQGITEFLPISSSGHLIVTREVLGWGQAGASFDIAVHVGTLAAVMVYFRADVARLIAGLIALLRRRGGADAALTAKILVATLPLLVVGALLVLTGTLDLLRQPKVIAWATLGFAIPLYLFDRFMATRRDLAATGMGQYLILGLAQALAVVPGTSRAGVTITAARALGLGREEAAHVSMLLAIPAVGAAGVWAVLDLALSGNLVLNQNAGLGAIMSFAVALAAIWGLMAWVKRASYTPFVLYRIMLGCFLLGYAYI